MKLIVGNKLITTPIDLILHRISRETQFLYLKDIKTLSSGWCMITCPFHGEHSERHPSCGVVMVDDIPDRTKGDYHCFACGELGDFISLIATCFLISYEDAKDWLIDNYATTILYEREPLEEIVLVKHSSLKDFLQQEVNKVYPESELDKYNYFNPYILSRGIELDVVNKYKIGYDPRTRCVTFPMWDLYGNLIAVNKRSVDIKKFILDPSRFKAVYLLNYALQDNAKQIFVTESQINALYLMSLFDVHAVALCGTGTPMQYKILKLCGIKNFVLCLDPDSAGRKGVKKFIENMPQHFMITDIQFPEGKDVNDLSKDLLIEIFNKNNIELVVKN